jgi:hypothetical protein
MSSERKPVLTGGCQCGRVRYALYAAPTGIVVCRCRMCQKAAGAPFGVFALLNSADVAWTRGRPATWRSSSRAYRDFCDTCGTPLAFRPLDRDAIDIPVGSLDEPEKAAPTYEVGREGKLSWLARLSSLPGKTTLESMGAERLAQVTSYQHPDHDTAEDWKPLGQQGATG